MADATGLSPVVERRAGSSPAWRTAKEKIMKIQEWTFIDKSDWGEGQWQREPDKMQWPDPETGLPCLALRHPTFGNWCGYVGVPPEHPFHGRAYYACSLPEKCEDDGEYCEHSIERELDPHGGVTFADSCVEEDKEHGICHVPDQGEPDDIWWFGFDCAHLDDASPGRRAMDRKYGIPSTVFGANVYRDLQYVRQECAAMARQLAGS
jgi:hypothetical protein